MTDNTSFHSDAYMANKSSICNHTRRTDRKQYWNDKIRYAYCSACVRHDKQRQFPWRCIYDKQTIYLESYQKL